MSKCKFVRAWIGECGKPLPCKDHEAEKCVSCGSAATHECGETGQFVCGFPLCENCEHTIFPSGTNGGIGFNAQELPKGMKRHCRKDQQVYKPWYERDIQMPEV